MTAIVFLLGSERRAIETLRIEAPRGHASIQSWFQAGYILHENTYYPMSSIERIQVYP